MDNNQAIFKIGGKILENTENLESTIAQLTKLYEENILQRIILIPGGGSYANFIRKVDAELKLGDDLAHWMAIYSMNYNGIELNRKYPELELIEDLKAFQDSKKIFCVFLPYNYLRKNDNLPHNWEVTSDSIALHIAVQLHLNKCFLIKDIDGIYNIKSEMIKHITPSQYKELKSSNKLAQKDINQSYPKKSTPIDSYLLTLVEQYGVSCCLINGSENRQRISEFFNPNLSDENKMFTKIVKK